jgi:hypothetical protein
MEWESLGFREVEMLYQSEQTDVWLVSVPSELKKKVSKPSTCEEEKRSVGKGDRKMKEQRLLLDASVSKDHVIRRRNRKTFSGDPRERLCGDESGKSEVGDSYASVKKKKKKRNMMNGTRSENGNSESEISSLSTPDILELNEKALSTLFEIRSHNENAPNITLNNSNATITQQGNYNTHNNSTEDRFLAVAKVAKNFLGRKSLLKEKSHLERLENCPGICFCFGFYDLGGYKAVLLTELATGTVLRDYLNHKKFLKVSSIYEFSRRVDEKSGCEEWM